MKQESRSGADSTRAPYRCQVALGVCDERPQPLRSTAAAKAVDRWPRVLAAL